MHHQSIVEAQEAQPLSPFDQMHDAGHGGLGRQPEIAQQLLVSLVGVDGVERFA